MLSMRRQRIRFGRGVGRWWSSFGGERGEWEERQVRTGQELRRNGERQECTKESRRENRRNEGREGGQRAG